MARKRKQLIINGKTFERLPGKSGRYFNVDNPSETLSRRQAEKGELAERGYGNYLGKKLAREIRGIPKGFRETVTGKGKFRQSSYHKNVDSVEQLRSEVKQISSNYRVYILAHYKLSKTGATGRSLIARGETLNRWRAITSLGTPKYILTYNFTDIRQTLSKQGFIIDGYQIRFTAKQNR